jgi:hypothetical protein
MEKVVVTVKFARIGAKALRSLVQRIARYTNFKLTK